MPIARDVFRTTHPRTYQELRGDIRNGDMLLCSGHGAFSRMIQMATWSNWSHVGFIFRLDDIDRIMVLESVERAGVRAIPLSVLVDGNGKSRSPYRGRLAIARHAAFNESVSPEKMKQMTQFALDRLATGYDMSEVMKIAARIMLGAFRIRVPGVLRPDDEYICSEYAYECYRHIGVEIPGHPLGFVAPSDFARCEHVDLVGVVKTRASPKRIRAPRASAAQAA